MARVSLAFIMVAMLLVAGCSKPTHESQMKDAIAKMNELATVLEGVTDEASAQAAKPKLEAINAAMKELKTKSDKIGKPSAEEQKRLKEKYEPELKQLVEKLMPQMFRVGLDPKLGPILKDSMPSDNSAPSFMSDL